MSDHPVTFLLNAFQGLLTVFRKTPVLDKSTDLASVLSLVALGHYPCELGALLPFM